VGVGEVGDVAFDASGSRLAVAAGTGPVRVFGSGDWKALPILAGGSDDVASHVVFAPVGDILGCRLLRR
jgi:hypothetical protein